MLNELNLTKLGRTKTTCNGKSSTNLDKFCIADIRATQDYIRVSTPCSNNLLVTSGPQVILPDRSLVQAAHREYLNINPLLTPTDSTYHIFPHLQSGAIISKGKLCDDSCAKTFTTDHLTVVKNVLTILEYHQSGTSGMWQVDLTSSPCNQPRYPIPV